MKNFNWISVILFLFSYSLTGQNIEELRLENETSFDFDYRFVLDHNRNIIGKKEGLQDFDKLEGFSDFVYRGKLNLINGKEIEIYPLKEVIVCEPANRIFSFGTTQFEHTMGGSPKLLIFDLEGNLISNYGTPVKGEYNTQVSKSGDIYFIGFSKNPNVKGKVIKKINKDGKLIWETKLPDELFYRVTGIQILDSNQVVILRSGRRGVQHGKYKYQSEVFVLNSAGQITSTGRSIWQLNNIKDLGDGKIFCSVNSLYFIEDVNDLKFDRYSYMPKDAKRPIKIRISDKGEKLAIIDNNEFLRFYKIDENYKFSLEKKTKLLDLKKLLGFYFQDEESIRLIHKDKFSTFR